MCPLISFSAQVYVYTLHHFSQEERPCTAVTVLTINDYLDTDYYECPVQVYVENRGPVKGIYPAACIRRNDNSYISNMQLQDTDTTPIVQ